MATQLQIRRGSDSQVSAFTGAEGEIVVNTTNDSIHVNDGSTAGGFELARVDGSNWAITNAISTTANISFGDNDKAIFGAGSDLQIYHDGAFSHIKDSGTGNLYIAGDNEIILTDAAENEYKARFNTNGSVQLYYDNAEKLATTSTGIDVTGTVTADGLTVDGVIDVTSTTSLSTNLQNTGGSALLPTYSFNGSADVGMFCPSINNLAFATSQVERLNIASNGDISFYEDTGTTPKFFWDASAESLGIGTSSPGAKLEAAGNLRITNATVANSAIFQVTSDATGSNGVNLEATYYGSGGFGPIKFTTSNTERMRILSTGGITFNGDTAQANALDDYEEGTWTPSIRRNDGTVSATHSTVGANYVKIGRTVIIKAWIHTINTTGTDGSTFWTIQGLPFSSTSYGAMALAYNTTAAESTYSTGSFSVLSANGVAYSGSLSGGFMIDFAYETNQ